MTKTFKTNFGPDGIGYLIAEITGDRITVRIDGSTEPVLVGYITESGEVLADGSECFAHDHLFNATGSDLSRFGRAVFGSAERLAQIRRSDYTYSAS